MSEATEDVAPVKTKKPKTPTEDLIPIQVKKAKPAKSNSNGNIESKSAKELKSLDKPHEMKGKKAAEASDKPNKEASSGVSAPAVSKADKSSSKKQKATTEKGSAKAQAKLTEDEDAEVDDNSEDEIDDQTEALLKGFESDRDEEDVDIEQAYKEGAPIPSITENENLSKKKQKKLESVAEFSGQGKPGVVYIGRVPHGFYENEMKAYFGQFGTILKLRLSRNKRTGASKHYAFIQFEDSSVADIVAKTMDNYLMFGHLLKVKFVPQEQVPANIWKGANKRFKKVPWNKIKGRELEQGASEETWEARGKREQERRDKKAEKLKAIGYEFDAPKIKSAKGVSKKVKPVPEPIGKEDEAKAIEAAPASDDEMKSIEAAPVADGSNKPKKKNKKSKATKGGEGAATVEEPNPTDEEKTSVDAKLSKEDIEESVAALIAETVKKPSKKEKKDKKNKGEVAASGLKGEEDELKPTKLEPATESASKPKKDKKKKKTKAIAE